MDGRTVTRAKLIFMAFILLATSILTISSTAAWFTFTTNPHITNIRGTAASNGNLRVALMKNQNETAREVNQRSLINGEGSTGGSTAKDYYTWGNLIDMSEIMGEDFLERGLWPIAFEEGEGFLKAVYAADGRVDHLVPVEDSGADYTSGREGVVVLKDNDVPYALRVDLWLRGNVDGTVGLTDAVSRSGAEEAQMGQGSYIKCEQYGDFPYDGIGVVFQITDENGGGEKWVQAELEESGDKAILKADDLFEMTANTSYKVRAYIYVNGLVVTNAHGMEGAIEGVEINLQFSHSGIGENGVAPLTK